MPAPRTKTTPPATKAKSNKSDFAGYLAKLPKDQQAALEKLRRAIHAAAPGLEECINYGVPAFRWHGTFLVAMGAAKDHCAFYPGTVIADLGVELKEYDTSKGTIRFSATNPLPATLVKKIMKARTAKVQAKPVKKKTASK